MCVYIHSCVFYYDANPGREDLIFIIVAAIGDKLGTIVVSGERLHKRPPNFISYVGWFHNNFVADNKFASKFTLNTETVVA